MDDSLSEKQRELDGLPAAEAAKRIAEIKKTCREYCGECPTYAGMGEKDFGFCMSGKSRVIREENGCMCPGCPVTSELSLRWESYCIRGNAKEQAEK
jgi:hypothetical protein